ncbi:MAG: hypothetical protein Kow0089_21290 [Desulfobulbaceae bacterium]
MTLLEIMLALLILATVVTMVSMSLSGSVNVMNATLEQGGIYHRAQVALQRISEDLASAVLVEDEDFVGLDEQMGSEEADSLRFTSTAHIVFNRETDHPGIALISYFVREDPEREGELLLYRADDLLLSSTVRDELGQEGQGFLLCDRLRSVNFQYISSDGEELDSWTTSADTLGGVKDRRLPAGVSCTLEFWVDREKEDSLSFTTSVLLPVGLINGQYAATQSGS